MTAFSTADPNTWPVTLTAEQVAAIYQCSVAGLKRRCASRTFTPSPFLLRPYRWRKADVLRDVEGARSLRRLA